MFFLAAIPLSGGVFHCSENIADIAIKGQEGEEKIFVKIERGIFPGAYPGAFVHKMNAVKQIVEQRTLVFMRDNRHKDSANSNFKSSKILKPTLIPDYSHTLVPTVALLFRFSALTFNAHLIHLDKQHCREVEGHRNLLVHGPLSLVLMVEVLKRHLTNRNKSLKEGKIETITSVEYRNLAPLYAEEEMKICIKEKEMGRFGRWDVWIENKDGGYAVKGSVTTERRRQPVIGKNIVRPCPPNHEENVNGLDINPRPEAMAPEGETA